jgi:hypothetical protein
MDENQDIPGKDPQGWLERLEDSVARIKGQLESGGKPFGNAAQREGVAPAVLTRRDVAAQIQDALAPILERLKGI